MTLKNAKAIFLTRWTHFGQANSRKKTSSHGIMESLIHFHKQELDMRPQKMMPNNGEYKLHMRTLFFPPDTTWFPQTPPEVTPKHY